MGSSGAKQDSRRNPRGLGEQLAAGNPSGSSCRNRPVRVTALLRVRTGVGMRLCTWGQPGRPTVMIRVEDRVGRQHLSSSA